MSVSIKNSVSGGGGGITSDEVTAIASDVLKGKTYVGNDTNDEIGTGTLELTGNAAAGDVLSGATFYNTNAKSKQTGTLALSGNATAGDVLKNATFYNTNPKSKQTGTLELTGNADPNNVIKGLTFYSNDAKYKRTGDASLINHSTSPHNANNQKEIFGSAYFLIVTKGNLTINQTSGVVEERKDLSANRVNFALYRRIADNAYVTFTTTGPYSIFGVGQAKIPQ